ncbi:hypothetical protein D3C72_2321530 [compost metagenome]
MGAKDDGKADQRQDEQGLGDDLPQLAGDRTDGGHRGLLGRCPEGRQLQRDHRSQQGETDEERHEDV